MTVHLPARSRRSTTFWSVPVRRRNKYGAQRVELAGRVFHSKGEAARWLELVHAERAGKIEELQCQVPFPLPVGVDGEVVGHYVADFVYTVTATGTTVIEDYKGSKATRTDVYRIKVKLMHACHGLTVLETTEVVW